MYLDPFAADPGGPSSPSSTRATPSLAEAARGGKLSNTDRPRSASRRRYRLPSPPPADTAGDCCCCCDASDGMADELRLTVRAGGSRARGSRRRSRGGDSVREQRVDKPELGARSGSGDSSSSASSSGSASAGPSSSSFSSSAAPRSRLFDDSDDDLEGGDELLMSSYQTDASSLQSLSPATPPSLSTYASLSSLSRRSSLGRSSSLRKKAATSDPLIAPSHLPPTLSSLHGHWLPSPPGATAPHCASRSPELPDTLALPAISSLSPSPAPAPSSPARRLTPPISLLTKSLRSLSERLPNLFPRLPTPDAYLSSSASPDELAALPPGWGSAERRRILAAEPSHAADEARGFMISLRRRGRSVLEGPPSPVDEVEAAAFTGAQKALLEPAASASPPPSPLPPSLDLSPLPPPSPASPPAPSPSPPPPRFISNHRHLLMLSLEFEMMRHAKIRGPLRQRAVIVRAGGSPPRVRGGAGMAESGLRREVCC
ncbi:hypothetical protein JCM10213_002794 [Rhodosporidiobolus nylandii]